MEILEKMWNLFKVNNEKTRTLFWYFYCYLWTYFISFSSVFVPTLIKEMLVWYKLLSWFNCFVKLNLFIQIRYQFFTIINKLPLHKKWSFPLRTSSVNVTKSEETCVFDHINLITFTEETLNGKLHFLCSVP